MAHLWHKLHQIHSGNMTQSWGMGSKHKSTLDSQRMYIDHPPPSLPLKEHVILCKRKWIAVHGCFLSYADISCTPSPPSALHIPHLPLGDQPSWSTSHSQPVPNTCQAEQGGAHHFQERGWGLLDHYEGDLGERGTSPRGGQPAPLGCVWGIQSFAVPGEKVSIFVLVYIVLYSVIVLGSCMYTLYREILHKLQFLINILGV